ncbi:MAG: hypothetical protein FJW99_06830 [Actinobacteria bacterium]|nr:hypothetical protein [Actinomycetota bacterium]MBM3697300.1 hypothetical protein [Actinomycetota bacterium]
MTRRQVVRRAARAIAVGSALATCALVAAPAVADGGRTAGPGSALLAGAWSGTASSTSDADFTFPLKTTMSVAATGRPAGTVDLGAPVNCLGTWTPVSTTGRVTTFAEDITSKVPGGDCIMGGTVRLSPAGGGRLRYVWTKGDDDGSVAYLDPVGVSGAWTGTLTQAGLGRVPMRLRVVGVSAGQMHGMSYYDAPLSCSGRLEPQGSGSQRRAVLREVITRSASSVCVGIGTMTVSMRSDGRLSYRWEGGGVISTATLRRAG